MKVRTESTFMRANKKEYTFSLQRQYNTQWLLLIQGSVQTRAEDIEKQTVSYKQWNNQTTKQTFNYM